MSKRRRQKQTKRDMRKRKGDTKIKPFVIQAKKIILTNNDIYKA